MLVAAMLDAVDAEQLERALTRHEEVAEHPGTPDVFTPALAQLRALAVQTATGGHGWTPADSDGAVRNGAPMREWLTISEAAEVLGMSERSVRRRVRSGELPSTLFGPRCRRVHVDALRAVA